MSAVGGEGVAIEHGRRGGKLSSHTLGQLTDFALTSGGCLAQTETFQAPTKMRVKFLTMPLSLMLAVEAGNGLMETSPASSHERDLHLRRQGTEEIQA
jgi:hypothetical protein